MNKNNSTGNHLTEKVPIKHFLLIMRTTLILLFTCVFCSMAEMSYTQNARVTINKRKATLKEVLNEIEKQTDYLFIYNNEVNTSEEVSVRAKQKAVSEVLNSILEEKDLNYSMEGNHILLSTNEKETINSEEIVSIIVQQKKKQIRGSIKDESGIPIIGANIIESGTTNGTITDVDGNFTLSIEEDAIIRISYIGYLDQDFNSEGRTVFEVILQEDTRALDELVVVGYGTMRKGDLTGAVSIVSSSDFDRIPAVNAIEALQARSPGLSIVSNSGFPGSDASVQIRGVQSISGTNEPIYVVDGIITNSISNISPSDIESFSVLKDASSTAIYGARASNGVILVTTKRGSTKSPEFSFNSYIGFQTESNLKMNTLNASQWLELFTEAHEVAGITPSWNDEILSYYDGVDTDWYSLMRQTGIVQNYDFGVSGGSESSNYYISANYINNKGVVLGSDYQRYSLRFNSDHRIRDWITFGNSLNVYSSKKNGTENMDGDSYYAKAFTKVPLTRAYEENGDFGSIYNTTLEHTFRNPIWDSENYVNSDDRKGVTGNLYLTLNILDGLDFTARGNLEWEQINRFDFAPGIPNHYRWEGSSTNYIEKLSGQNLHWTTDFLLNYQKRLADVHDLNALMGYSLEENTYEYLSGSRSDTPNNDIQYLSAGDPATQLNENGMTDWAFVSYFGRFNYTYNNKYLFSGTLRRDGTSRLSNNQFGLFPSAAVAWRISEESFFDNISIVDDLKARLSIGSVGNAQSISVYGTIPALSLSNIVLNQQQAQGYTLNTAVNSDLKWENTLKKNFGIDAVLFNNQIFFSADFFVENTYDLLFRQPIPLSTGLSGRPFINAGEVKNTGFEFDIGYRKKINDWSFDFSLILSHFKNEVIDLEGRDLLTSGIVEGFPLNSYFGYKSNGLIRTQEDLNNYPHMSGKEIGDIWILDVNGTDSDGNLTGKSDGVINASDRTLLGKRYPDFTTGALTTIGYKNFTFQLQLQGVHGVDMSLIEEGRSIMHWFTSWAMNHHDVILDRYHPTKNPNGEWPRVNLTDGGKNNEFSDFWLDDASYLRIKNININYTFNDKVTDFFKMSRLSIYASIQNLYTFTNFIGAEVDTSINPLIGAAQPTTWTLGLRVGF